MEWKNKIDLFLKSWEHRDEIIGILVYGDYDKDDSKEFSFYILLSEQSSYREEGSRIIDEIMISYLAATPLQFRKYFEEDYRKGTVFVQRNYALGKIMFDRSGDIKKLQDEAISMLRMEFRSLNTIPTEEVKHRLWLHYHELQILVGRPDFDFLFFLYFDDLLSIYMKCMKVAYDPRYVLNQLTSKSFREKEFLSDIPDEGMRMTILTCFTNKDCRIRLEQYYKIMNYIFSISNGFKIDGFTLKSVKALW